jgi:hypothetical protein
MFQSLRLIGPPDWRARQVDGELPEPGAILILKLAGGADEAERLAGISATWPWCPIAVVVPPSVGAISFARALLPPGSPFILVKEPAVPEGLVAAVTQSVRCRPTPPPGLVADYVSRRIGRAEGGNAVLGCLSGPADETIHGQMPSRSALWRHLKRFGCWTARDWRALYRLVELLARSAPNTDQRAWVHGVDPRTARAWCRRLLGVPLSQAATIPGWEWMAETALRRGGYVPPAPPPVSSPAPARQEPTLGRSRWWQDER